MPDLETSGEWKIRMRQAFLALLLTPHSATQKLS